MSISISEFKSWAGQNQNAAVAVVNGALADASNQIGVVDRLFKRGTVNGVRSATMKEFTRALSTRYGTAYTRLISRGHGDAKFLAGSMDIRCPLPPMSPATGATPRSCTKLPHGRTCGKANAMKKKIRTTRIWTAMVAVCMCVSGLADVGPQGRVLNNFVRELVNAPLRDDFALVHDAFDFHGDRAYQTRGALYLLAGRFDPAAEQPIVFTLRKLFSPRPIGNSCYLSYTCVNGQGVLWYNDRKYCLLGRISGEEFFK